MLFKKTIPNFLTVIFIFFVSQQQSVNFWKIKTYYPDRKTCIARYHLRDMVWKIRLI